MIIIKLFIGKAVTHLRIIQFLRCFIYWKENRYTFLMICISNPSKSSSALQKLWIPLFWFLVKFLCILLHCAILDRAIQQNFPNIILIQTILMFSHLEPDTADLKTSAQNMIMYGEARRVKPTLTNNAAINTDLPTINDSIWKISKHLLAKIQQLESTRFC